MDINVTINQADLSRLQALPGMMQVAMRRATLAAAQRAATDLQRSTDTPRWKSNLANSTTASPTADGAKTQVNSPYAYTVHQGRNAGKWPNITNIIAWADSKQMAGQGFGIARKIKENGIKARPWVKNYVSSLAFEAMCKQEVSRAMV